MQKSFLQYPNLFATHQDNPLKLCSKTALKKPQILYTTDYSEKLAKVKALVRMTLLSDQLRYFGLVFYLLTRKYMRENAQVDPVLD